MAAGSSVSFEPDPLVGSVAEGFVLGMATAAKEEGCPLLGWDLRPLMVLKGDVTLHLQ